MCWPFSGYLTASAMARKQRPFFMISTSGSSKAKWQLCSEAQARGNRHCSKLQLVCTVGEFDVYKIKPDMPVEVKVDALKQMKLQGKVEKVSRFAKSGTDQGTGAAQFEVTISLEPNEKLIAGLSLTGTIETEKKQGAIVVPTLAVMREKDAYYVMLQTSQGAERRDIEIGMETPEKTEVLKGLNVGDTVVLQ